MFICPDCGYKCQDEETDVPHLVTGVSPRYAGVSKLREELDALRDENERLNTALWDLGELHKLPIPR